ncbi:MAG: sugar kinase [Chloroflexi bacterium]|nr:sugar kinase [Chloroflexota bacterium]
MVAYVIGRLSADLYPLQINTPLEDVRTFERFVGGFAGNVATGLARLGVDVAIVSALGDDGHGRFVRRFLANEGVDVRWLGTHPTLRTALAFCEAWPPDNFPLTFYREPTCPDWELRLQDVPLDELDDAPLVYVTGTGLAREPSRSTVLGILERRVGKSHTIFDLDWRPSLWLDHAPEYPVLAHIGARLADVVIGGDGEFRAAGLSPQDALALGARLAIAKHGPEGVSAHTANGDEQHVPGLAVPVVNGLGAGDAFGAAFGAGLLAGLSVVESIQRGNAAGAIVATRLSCSTAMPRADEVNAVLAGASIVDGEVRR